MLSANQNIFFSCVLLNIQTLTSRYNIPIITGCEENVAIQRMDINALDHFVMKVITLLCYGIAEEDLNTLKVSWSEIHESGQLTKRTDRSKSIRKYTVLNLRDWKAKRRGLWENWYHWLIMRLLLWQETKTFNMKTHVCGHYSTVCTAGSPSRHKLLSYPGKTRKDRNLSHRLFRVLNLLPDDRHERHLHVVITAFKFQTKCLPEGS